MGIEMKMGGSYDGIVKRQKLKKDYQYKIFHCPKCGHTMGSKGNMKCGMCSVNMIQMGIVEDGEWMKGKINELVNAWVKWNMKEMSGNDFAMLFQKLFKEETTKRWDFVQKERKILSKLLIKGGDE